MPEEAGPQQSGPTKSGPEESVRDSALEDFNEAVRRDDPELLYDQAPCGYLSTTPDGRIVKANQTLLTWTGYSRDELVGSMSFVQLLTPGGRIFHETHYAPQLRMQGMAREIAVDLRRQDGSRFPVILNANTDRDAEGRTRAVRIALFDATERRSYERELVRAKEKAEAAEHRARALANSLQRTLIPPTPPEIPGLGVVTAYRPAGRGVDVGGDFYDVFPVGHDDWIVVLGDVCGKGVDAAAVSALIRHTVRALAVLLESPAAVVAGLDGVLSTDPSGKFCTLVLMRLRRAQHDWGVTLVVAGHPPPYLLRPGAGVTAIGGRSPLVGVLDEAVFTETQVDLHAGDLLVLYTDGVTEARRHEQLYGDERLVDLLASLPPSAETVVPTLVEAVLDYQLGEPTDDIAVVAIEVPVATGMPLEGVRAGAVADRPDA